MLAEGDSSYLPKNGFDAVYPWHMFHMMEKIAKGDRPAFGLDSIQKETQRCIRPIPFKCISPAIMMKTAGTRRTMEVFPAMCMRHLLFSRKPWRVVCRLIYSGQEEPVLRPLQFFEKDPIEFGKFGRAEIL